MPTIAVAHVRGNPLDKTAGDSLHPVLHPELRADPAAALRHLRHAVRRLAASSLDRPDEVHRARRVIRGLRLLLSLFREEVGERRRHRLDEELRSLGFKFGRLRDWDVLRARVLACGERQMIAEIDRRRRKALRAIERRLDSRRFQRLDAGLKAATRRLRRRTDDQGRVEIDPLPMLDRRWQRFRQQLAAAHAGDAESLHALRRQLRKLRQSCRWLTEWLPRPASATFMRTLQRAQDRLGLHHDFAIEQRLLAKLDQPWALSSAARKVLDPRGIDRCLRQLAALASPVDTVAK